MSNEFVTHDVPEVGSVRARVGTSTAELAGAASYWHKQHATSYQQGYKRGLIHAGFVGIVSLAAALIHFL